MKDLFKAWGVGAMLAAAGCAVGLVVRSHHWGSSPGWFLPLVSLLSFAVGTVGRIGPKSHTWSADSLPEKLDQALFFCLYFIGIIAGVAALP